ncbi:probable metal-nicotianamine transporter YSL12 [Amborella trichopoda]|uniref:probable metal-nicotianamine transporter YSL12 n=1 Tax=Amborella trichopoda TaxID=13333 RepID=UPI0009BDF8A0|nr:probable metal-nicotianamine transporter YSL12 [Amborella trichopoda]|eukprot:XP_020523829.1 probable metal-nicotianamine transporter YSL12 [Amborella trichopoda]
MARRPQVGSKEKPYFGGFCCEAQSITFHLPYAPCYSTWLRKQVRFLGKYFTISFLWSFFKWFYSGDGDCGFGNFPILGLKAQTNGFYSDMSLTYVGAGMICPHLINISLLLGGTISWGLLWPLIKTREGDWYPAGLKARDVKGLFGYKVFIAIALILGDGLYNFLKILAVSIFSFYKQQKKNQMPTLPLSHDKPDESLPPLKARRNEIFMKDHVPLWFAASGYTALAAISIGVIPKIFPSAKWYYILISYLIAPVLGFCNAYGCGLTDWSLASTYGKLGIFVFSAWAGQDGGVLAGLALCGVMMIIVQTAADLMQDFKTGYITLSSPRSMFASQILGTLMGCILAPLTFWLFWVAFDVGISQEYPAPYGVIYREMALLGVGGVSSLPKHCLSLCGGFFAFSLLTNSIKDMVPKKVSMYIPIPMAMSIPFYIGPYFAIDMALGSLINAVWGRLNKREADLLGPAVASGLICGDGIWTLPAAALTLAKVKPPICMAFLSRGHAAKLSG